MKISPTGINIYRQCPRKFYFYVQRYPKIKPAFKEALDFGSIVHRIIARYYEIMPDDIVPDEVKMWVTKAYKELFPASMEHLRNRIENQLLSFINFEKKRLSWHFNPKPVAVEKEYSKQVGNVVVHGIIDAIFRKNGKTIIVDWKTGKSTADLTEDIIVQLNVYMWLTGADEAYALFLEYGTFKRLVQTVDVEEIVKTIASDRNYVPKKGKYCAYCEYQIACIFKENGLDIVSSMWWEP